MLEMVGILAGFAVGGSRFNFPIEIPLSAGALVLMPIIHSFRISAEFMDTHQNLEVLKVAPYNSTTLRDYKIR
jgi:hypothetical protein